MTTSQVGKEEQLNLESLTWGNLTWINIEGPTEQETEYLAQNYHFHHLDLDDCLSRIQRPKIDEYEDYLFLIFHFNVYNKATRVSALSQVSVFIGEKYLITLHSGELKTLSKLFRECQIDEEARRDNFSHGSGYLLYRILDRAVDAYFPVLDKIMSLMEDVEDSVFDENVEAAQGVANLRRDIITQRRLFFSLRPVMAELESKLKRFATIDMSVQWGDLIDHMNKIWETLDECKELIEVFKDTDYVLSTDRINRIMRLLTILSLISLPFVILNNIYSMNIVLPGGLNAEGNPKTFFILVAAMFFLSGAIFYFFHRKRWI